MNLERIKNRLTSLFTENKDLEKEVVKIRSELKTAIVNGDSDKEKKLRTELAELQESLVLRKEAADELQVEAEEIEKKTAAEEIRDAAVKEKRMAEDYLNTSLTEIEKAFSAFHSIVLKAQNEVLRLQLGNSREMRELIETYSSGLVILGFPRLRTRQAARGFGQVVDLGLAEEFSKLDIQEFLNLRINNVNRTIEQGTLDRLEQLEPEKDFEPEQETNEKPFFQEVIDFRPTPKKVEDDAIEEELDLA